MSDAKHVWIGGVNAVAQALMLGKVQVLHIAEHKRSKKVQALQDQAESLHVAVNQVPGYEIDLLLPGVRHQGVAACCVQDAQAGRWQDCVAGRERPFLLILDSIQDPHNLGACLRSAAAAGVDGVLIPNSRAAEITPTVRKVASGAAELMPVFRVANLRREVMAMQEQGIWVVAAAGEAEQPLYDVDLTVPLAVVVGNEGEGIHYGLRQQCDYLASIPMDAQMESLNVSVACGIMLFEVRRQRLFGGR